MESKLQMLIDDKLGQKIEVLPKISERMEEQHQASDMPNTEVMNYSKTVTGSIDFRKIMREARNEEKVEEKEKEKRSKNFIVHGVAEIGEQNEDIKENDVKIIKSFLHTVGTTSEPESFILLGKPNERKKRTLKVVMKTKQEKEYVLANLKLLKGTVEEFGKISVTDDYTSHEENKLKVGLR